ncbi:hypothetical protein [Streptomyces sp. NPDC089919]|uniref:hypothetical protein n=1 Tax=Streptomyces sp. NPDC089919 TaxID=3155188 RepID=UPI00341DC0B7
MAGSSLATIAAAYLASKMGVYGTILGAGVVSVVATAGGPVIQHFFKRTGETIREGGEAVRPKARQVRTPPAPAPGPYEDATRILPAADRTQLLPAADPDRTRLLRAVDPTGRPPVAGEDFGAASTHGTRVRGWRAKALAAALVFGVSMGGIAVYEQVSGNTSTFGGVTTGGSQHRQQDPAPEKGEQDRPTPDGGGATHRQDPGPDPSRSTGGDPTPTPGPSHSTDPTPSPSPSDPTPTPTPPTPEPTPTPHRSTGADGGPGADGGTPKEGNGATAGTG